MAGRVLAVLIWLITLASVILFLSGWWFPTGISNFAPGIDAQFMRTIIVVAVAFVAAQVALGYAVWRYRADAGGERAVYSHGNNRLEIIWTIVTAVIFIGLAVMGQRVWASLHFEQAPPGSVQIGVVAQQFQWNFHYPGADNAFGRTDPKLIRDSELNFVGLDESDPRAKDDSVVSTLVIPANRPVELLLRSKDVTHSFWSPPLRIKQDLVPGMELRFHFTATREGKYEIACAELCGQLHFKMRSFLLVLPEAEHRDLMMLPQVKFQVRVTELLNKYPLTKD